MIGRFIASLRVTGPLQFAPAMALILGLGIWLVLDSSRWRTRLDHEGESAMRRLSHFVGVRPTLGDAA